VSGLELQELAAVIQSNRALRAEVSRLQRALDEAIAERDSLRDESHALRAEVDRLRAQARAAGAN